MKKSSNVRLQHSTGQRHEKTYGKFFNAPRIKNVTNTARRRSTEENGNDSSDQSESDEESTVHSTRNVSIIKKEEEGSMVDLTEEEPPKIIETISLESDNDEEENVTATPTTHNSVTNTEYTFSETVQDVNRKTVEELITFIKINDEELHNNIRNVLREQKISGSKFMSLSSTDFYQMKLHLKDQVKILQITNKIHQNSR
ncbi:hypothetical protein C9374_011199 [Naegleria lovaniensis]|uniref:Uncharacterized protein n=1 Tax=Naegleria lovaniensis TaxID=51637 RepID=A0AA88KCS2_NAELO|nr:uncharacterized protein C9374_011199 [Naegleria lovaniensis]KAG2374120.1 hypothetical protein C9374_011199 [Naegleria lovaniensis]